MTQETQTGTLEDLNVKPGDVVQAVKTWRNGFDIKDGGIWTIHSNIRRGVKPHFEDSHPGIPLAPSTVFTIVSRATQPLTIEAGKYYKTRDGRKAGPPEFGTYYPCIPVDGTDMPQGYRWNGKWGCSSSFGDDENPLDLIAEWTDTPPTWCEMTGAEKGALLLAELDGECLEQKGRVIVNGESLFRWAPKQEGCWLDKFAYRIKPEPLVETVTLYGDQNVTGWTFYPDDRAAAPHRITFTTTNGEPDLDSIKMERIND